MEDPLDFIEKRRDSDEPLHIGLKILAFVVPISGFVMYFMYKQDKPVKARDASIAALFGFGLGIAMKVMESAM